MKIRIFIISLLIFYTSITFSDGFIVIPEPIRPRANFTINKPFPLEVKYHNVDVEIDNLTSKTSIDQEFYNPTNYQLEGFYIFPIPKNASISKFSMYINGKETQAELLNAKKAKQIFEDIVRKQMDPALLEYKNRDIFKVRIFPIEPKKTKRIKISYTEILTKDGNTINYTYPLNTEKFSSKDLENININVDIKNNYELKNIYSTTHEINYKYENSNYIKVSYFEKKSKPDKDFKLYFNTGKDDLGVSLLTFNDSNDDGFFFLNISPGINNNQKEIINKDITFVFDNSGSMAGEKLKKAKNALNYCINNLNDGDRFDIIRFSTDAESLFNQLKDYNSQSESEAEYFIKKLRPIGGTNIEEALSLALNNSKLSKRLHLIIFITDGKPTIGETKENNLIKSVTKANTNNTRIFTFGIGEEINIHLLDKITELTKSYSSYILPEEDIELKISDFFKKVQNPILTNIRIKLQNSIRLSKVYPKELPDLFLGQSLSILGRYKGSNKNQILTLIGDENKKETKHKYNLNFPEKNLNHEYLILSVYLQIITALKKSKTERLFDKFFSFYLQFI